jgi:hypothetical protein
MAEQFAFPEEYEIAYRRILPYLSAPLQREPQVLKSLLLYLKLGGERLARIAIDALNVSQRQRDAEMLKLLRQEAMLADSEDEDEELDENEDEEDEEDDAFDEEARGNVKKA